jgi:hypothetical protein
MLRFSRVSHSCDLRKVYPMDVIDGKWIAARLTGRRGEKADLARHIGVGPDIVAKILSGDRKVQPAEAPRVVSFFGDERPTLSGEADAESPTTTDMISVFDIHASAGDGMMVLTEDEACRLEFPRGYLQTITKANPRYLAIIGVKGDSMLPTLADDDIVMLDRSKRDLSYDGLFVIRDNGDGLLVKRIGRASKAGHVAIISDNRALYHPVEKSLTDIEVIGKVIWSGGKV